ncbi:ThiF family adenylyltransferase [Microbacterium aurantiacum]|uniref:ThiF family adenylyltransferase n=1 Tax=Microbacterium aurantiacum TaxID=162393 RepID=A0ABT8FS35_9MICO|nr:ThiF family adenylyltransferase [Microbacterium aurantiacum]MDN4464123.1 ThiF family adenylyltransferase [Microbacterium aurantiacum]
MPLPPLVAPVDALDPAEASRTARHAVLAGFGEIGQRRLAAAHVAVIGAGGLGSPVILALAAAGVGRLTVIDDDVVEVSNLQRQVLHRHRDAGRPKTASAVRAAADLSPGTRVDAVTERIAPGNAAALLADADVVIDGSDTFATRRAVADACESLGIPLVWGVVQEFHAQVTIFWTPTDAALPAVRLADLYPEGSEGDVPTCAAVGVLGSLCIQVGGILATETVKLLTGIGEPLLGRVLVVDALRGRTSEVPLRPSRMPVPAVSPANAPAPTPVPDVDLQAALSASRAGALLLDVREPAETATGTIPGSVTIPLADLLAEPARVTASSVVVICHAGGRAHRAAEALRSRGVDAAVLAGGLSAWPHATDLSPAPSTIAEETSA